MNAAQQEDIRERQINKIRRDVEKVLPFPTTAIQRGALEQVILMNISSGGKDD